MNEEIQMVLMEAQDEMKGAVSHLEKELTKIRAGQANPIMLQGLNVDYYGAPTPINQVTSIVASDARTLVLQPFDKSSIPNIETAIRQANLGFNPQNDGLMIRVPIPQLTEERRKELVKKAREVGEKSKIALRSVRREKNEALKKLKGDGVPEDEVKRAEDNVQNFTNTFSKIIDDLLSTKESEIMTI